MVRRYRKHVAYFQSAAFNEEMHLETYKHKFRNMPNSFSIGSRFKSNLVHFLTQAQKLKKIKKKKRNYHILSKQSFSYLFRNGNF